MKSFIFDNERVYLRIDSYTNKQLHAFLECEDGEPYANLTVTDSEIQSLPPYYTCFDSNNYNMDGLKILSDLGLIEKRIYGSVESGFCIYPVIKFIKETLMEYCSKEDIDRYEQSIQKTMDTEREEI